jgi:dTDP-4-dehydrorhamnose reductase
MSNQRGERRVNNISSPPRDLNPKERLMRILVTGAAGMLGSDLCPTFSQSHDVIPTDIGELDVRDPAQVFQWTTDVRPDLIAHLAAATDVDECERNPDLAYATNAIGTRNVALACQRVGAIMVYISTISVFDGTKCEPYTEFDAPNPQSHYSRAKYAGEEIVRSLLSRYFIIRAGWMFGGQTKDKKFVAKIIALAREKPSLMIVDDKFGSPTYTADFSRGIARLIETELFGTYHLVGAGGACSRFEFARAILDYAGVRTCQLYPVSSAAFPLPAPRPRMEGARNYHLELLGQSWMRPWREALEEYIDLMDQGQ